MKKANRASPTTYMFKDMLTPPLDAAGGAGGMPVWIGDDSTAGGGATPAVGASGAGEAVVSQVCAGGEGISGEGISGEGISGEGISGEGISGEGISGDGIPGAGDTGAGAGDVGAAAGGASTGEAVRMSASTVG